jgi:hypothetical protein
MNEVLKDVDWNLKETGTMSDTQKIRTIEDELIDAKRLEVFSRKRAVLLDEIVQDLVRKTCDARVEAEGVSKHNRQVCNQLGEAGAQLYRARQQMLSIREWMEAIHYKASPRHEKKPNANLCDWCAQIAKLVRAAQEAGR